MAFLLPPVIVHGGFKKGNWITNNWAPVQQQFDRNRKMLLQINTDTGEHQKRSEAQNEPPLFKFVGMRMGFIPEFESRLMNGHGAITPGPFIIYGSGSSKDPRYANHEPGHVIQYHLMGPLLYYGFVAIPSLIYC